MIQRLLRLKTFLASTLEELEEQARRWLIENQVCPGNLVSFKLYKHGGVYQLLVWHAVVEDA